MTEKTTPYRESQDPGEKQSEVQTAISLIESATEILARRQVRPQSCSEGWDALEDLVVQMLECEASGSKKAASVMHNGAIILGAMRRLATFEFDDKYSNSASHHRDGDG